MHSPAPYNPDAVRKLVARIIEDNDLVMKELSTALGRNHAYIQQFLDGTPHELKERDRKKLSQLLGVEDVSLIDGVFRATEFAQPLTAAPNDEFLSVPEVEITLSAGGGYVVDSESIRRNWRFAHEFLVSELRVAPTQVVIAPVRGDSMEPVLESGDYVMIDQADKHIGAGGIFAIWDGEGLVIKRVERVFDDPEKPTRIRLISDNARHTPYEVELEWVTVIGRAVWFSRKM